MSPNMRCRFGAWSPAYCGVTTWRQRPGGKPSSIFGRNGIGITRLHCQCVMQVPARRMEPAGRGARRVLKSSPRQVGVGVKRVLDLGVSVVVPAPDANAPPVFGGQPYFSISFGRDSGPCGRTWCTRREARRACPRCRRRSDTFGACRRAPIQSVQLGGEGLLRQQPFDAEAVGREHAPL